MLGKNPSWVITSVTDCSLSSERYRLPVYDPIIISAPIFFTSSGAKFLNTPPSTRSIESILSGVNIYGTELLALIASGR